MNIARRHLSALGVAAAAFVTVGSAHAASAEEQAVAKRVEAFRAAQFAADPKALAAFCSEALSYSHSDAHIEDKATFVKNATSGKSKFVSLEYKDLTVRVVGDAAIVRFHWVAESVAAADGKHGNTSLAVLMTWHKRGGVWKLLDRASTKV